MSRRVLRWSVPLALACLALVGSSTGSASPSSLLAPEVEMTFSPSLPTANEAVTFDVTASDENPGGSVTSYAWDFDGDGIPDSTLQHVVHGFATGGDHEVTVTATTTEADGTTHLSASDARLVHVHAANLPPTVDGIHAEPIATPKAGAPVQLFAENATDPDAGPQALTYDWNFGDGKPHSTASTPTHVFDAAGTYLVTLTVSDGQDTATAAVAVAVHATNRPPVILEADASPVNAAPGGEVDFNADAVDDATATAGLTFSWDFGDGNGSTDRLARHSYANAGLYVVTLSVGDGDRTSYASFVQAVGQPPSSPSAFFSTDYDRPFFGINDGVVPAGTSMAFYDDSFPTDPATITGRSWSWGDGTSDGSGTQPAHAFALPGHYDVVETVTDSNDNVSKYAETVTVSSDPQPPEITMHSSVQRVGIDQAVDFSSSAFDPDNPPTPADRGSHVTYAWDFGDGTGSTDPQPNHVYATGGAKIVTLTVTDADDAIAVEAALVILVHAENIPPAPSFHWSPQRPGTGQLVSFSNDSTDADDPTGTLTYSWDFGDGATSTQTNPTHTYANPGDYFVTLTATDPNGGVATEGFSVQVLLDGIVAPTNVSRPVVTGTAQVGETLSASAGVWEGTQPITFSFVWLRCDAAGANCAQLDATDQDYVLASADLGHTMKVGVVAVHDVGNSSSAESDPTSVVTVAPPTVSSSPTISGAANVGAVLTANAGTWSGTPAITFTYQWQQCTAGGSGCGDIAGASASTYTIAAGDAGHTIRVEVTAHNASSIAPTAVATPSAVVTVLVVAPGKAADPAITGVAREGQTLTETPGTFSGTSPAVTHQWQRCDSSGAGCAAIAGAPGTSFTLTSADVGHTIRVLDTASNSAGSATGTSAPTAVVLPAAPTVTTPPSISGTATVGEQLATAPGVWTGSPTLTYQWQRCDASGGACIGIAGATSTTYALVAADQDHALRVRVTGANGGGSFDSTSAPTAAVAGAPGGAGGAGLTAAQIRAKIACQIAPKGSAAKIARLLRTGHYDLLFSAPAAGSATIQWFYVPAGAPKPILLASGRHSFSNAGTATIRLTLTGAARPPLRKHSSLRLTGKATFTPSGASAVTATRAFTLRR